MGLTPLAPPLQSVVCLAESREFLVMPYKLIARMPVILSGTFVADFPSLESALQDAKILLKQSKDFLLQIYDPAGTPVNMKEHLDADRT